jgi:hypothetical protein
LLSDSTFPVPECRGNDSAIQRNMFCNENREIISKALLAPPPSGATIMNQLASITNFCSSVADIPRLLDPDNSLEPKHSPEKTLSQPSHVTKPSSDPVEPKLPAEPPDVTKPSYDPTPAISLPPYRLATAGLPNFLPDSTFPVP